MIHRIAAALVIPLLALTLTACSGNDSNASTEAVSTPVETVQAPEATPESTEATPEQLASIVAGYETDWRDTIEGAGDCRLTWTVGDATDPTTNMEGMACFLNEQTLTMTAETAGKDLRALTPPSSMQTLYDDTLTALDGIKSVPLEDDCGTDSWPSSDETCSTTLGELFTGMRSLETVLDQWGPYL
jgi:hypothetical protein